MSSSAIRLEGVRLRYGETVAVDGLDLEVLEGEVLGLLGPNGAGKTTTVGIATGLLVPQEGRVSVGGRGSPREAAVRRGLGVAPQALALYDALTGAENLAFFGALHGLGGDRLAARVAEALSFVGLEDRAKDRVTTYSGGMKRRLNLAAAIVHDPKVVVLDEPTVGVDPQSRNLVFDKVLELRRAGRTLVYSTHYMEEAERLCDRVAILDRGRLLALDTVEGLLRAHGERPVLVIESDAGESRVPTDDPVGELRRRVAGGPPVSSFRLERCSLEQVFLHLTGRRLRD